MEEPKVEVKVSVACPLKQLGKSCDYGDKDNILPDGTPLCLGRMESGCLTFCIHMGQIEIKRKQK